MVSFFLLVDTLLSIYAWIVILSAVMSWLVAFGVVNQRNAVVYTIGRALYQLTEPAIRPIRRILPNLGGIDISPVVVLLIIFFLRSLLREYGPL